MKCNITRTDTAAEAVTEFVRRTRTAGIRPVLSAFLAAWALGAAWAGGPDVAAVREGWRYLAGTAGNSRTRVEVEARGAALSGRLVYEIESLSGKSPVREFGAYLPLSGTMLPDGSFALDVLATDGSPLGAIIGKVSDGGVWAGDWKTPDQATALVVLWRPRPPTPLFRIEPKVEILDESKKDLYFISVTVPRVVRPDLPEWGEALSYEIGSLFTLRLPDVVRDFKKTLESVRGDVWAKSYIKTGKRSEWTVDYSIHHTSNRYASFHFQEKFFALGAPRTLATSLTANLDFKSGRVVRLKELFRKGSGYLKILSDLCRKRLKDKLELAEAEWVDRGAAPEEDNFSSFLIMENGMLVLFDPHQVAPFSEGPQQVFLPWGELKPAMIEGFTP